MISKKVAIEVLNAGLATGADFAEIYIEEKLSNNIVIDNGKVENSVVSKSYGAGIRLLQKFRSVYGYTNDISRAGLLKLAQSLSNSFKGKQEVIVSNIKNKKFKNVTPIEIPFSQVNKDEIVAYLKKGAKAMQEYDPRIIRTSASIAFSHKNITIYNSNELCIKDENERGRIAVQCVAAEDQKIETGYSAPGAASGFEFFKNNVDIEKLGKEAAAQAILMLGAKECPSGKMPVVIGNGFGGVLFHEACGHPLEASAVSKNLSVFANKIGQQIASPLVTAIDDGTIVNGWGSNNVDDEGNKTSRTVLIEKGILKNYLIDDFNGRRMGEKGNGACRRQSYKFEPTSRMSNTYIDKGESTPEEIIAATKLGLYAKSLGGGSVNPATGEFNFACSEAYIIRDGKVCEPVRGASLIGQGKDILMKIDMVGNDLERAQGMCGAASGSIPVDVGQPTLRISEITVGGNGGELK